MNHNFFCPTSRVERLSERASSWHAVFRSFINFLYSDTNGLSMALYIVISSGGYGIFEGIIPNASAER